MSSVPFVNHHVHSHFSALDGLSKPDDIINRVVEMGQPSISITDHGTMAGIPQMYAAAKKAGIGFTPGIEAYFTKDRKYHHPDRLGEKYYHMILLAHSNEGYHNLVKMQTPSWEEGRYVKPRVDYEVLEQYSKDITVTTSCLGGIIPQLLLRNNVKSAEEELGTMIDIFGKENVFIELQRHGMDEQEAILPELMNMHKKFGLPLLATADSHYTHQCDHGDHDTLLCCSVGRGKFEDDRFKFESDQHFLHSGEEMLKLFPEEDFPGAVSNTVELAERTNFSMPMGDDLKYIMPSVPTEGGLTEAETLRKHVIEGASSIERYGDDEGNIPDEVIERIDYELEVINNMGFPGYFLIVENFIKLFAQEGIFVGPGRGCLDPDTEVLTQYGWTKIKDMNVGDSVITARGEASPVIEIPKHIPYEGEQLVSLCNSDGEKIILTEKHKVLSIGKDGNYKWVKACNIRPGDSIVSVTGNNKKSFENNGLNSKDKKSAPVLMDSSLGYISGMAVSSSTIKGNTVSWKFKDCQSTVSETLLSCCKKTISGEIKEKRNKNGNITHISVESDFLATKIKNDIEQENKFISHGPRKYSLGFLQGMQSGYTDLPSTNRIPANDDYSASVAEQAAMSAGIPAVRDGSDVVIPSLKSSGVQRISMVVDIETIPATKTLYDLTVQGHPSFLTRFGTVHNSAPGSVVVYCLGITNIDPFRHDLFFERFLNPDRISMPDIDIDIPKTQRKKALAILEREYGHGHVAHISNYSTMGTKESLERVGKAYGLSPSDADKFKNSIVEFCEETGQSLKEVVESGSIPPEVSKRLPETRYSWEIMETSAKISGTLSAYSTHACGIVITTERVDEYFPLRFDIDKNGNVKGLPICQFDGYDIESLGGVKMDLLGLINLDEVEDTERNIRIDLGEEISTKSLPLDDKKVYEMLAKGRGGGVFQLGCLAGDTIVDGRRIDHWYQLRNSTQRASSFLSVFMGEGYVGRNEALEVVYSGKKDTISIDFDNGRNLVCTPEHYLFTSQGWKKAGELEESVDEVLCIDGDYEFSEYMPTIRGREDILDMFEEMNPELIRIEKPFPVTSGETTFHPAFHDYGSLESLVLIYPDNNPGYAERAQKSFNSIKGKRLDIYSYSEVCEMYYSYVKDTEDMLTPLGTHLSKVKGIKDNGVIKTYDIMMKRPVNNFIANGVMVHNSSGMQDLLRMMKPDNFEDISAALALYRPGPMGMKTHTMYALRKNGKGSDNDVAHEDMRELMKSTHSLPVYQEDIMKMSTHFAGYTGGEADTLRKATAKKIPAMMEEQRKKFVPAVNERHGGNLGQKLWDIIEPFGAYAFNRSHSAAYAMISYRTAYLKAHYPAQFSGAVIDYNLNDKNKLVETIDWVRQEGVKISNPDINTSELRSVTGQGTVILPLHIISGLGVNKAEEIIRDREENGKFTSVVDFVSRTRVSQNLLISIIKSGAFDCLGVQRASIMASTDAIMSASSVKRSRNEMMKDSLFGELIDDSDDDDMVDLSVVPERVSDGKGVFTVDDDTYGKWERESIGVILGPHPFSTIRELNSSRNLLKEYPPIDSAKTTIEKGAKFSGIITNISRKISKKGNNFSVFDIETERRVVPGICFTHINESYNDRMVIVEGKMENDGDEDNFVPKMICFDMKSINTDKMKQDG